MLLASALLVRSVSRMIHAPVGVMTDDVVTAKIQLSGRSYSAWEDVQQFYTVLLESVRRQSGVDEAGAATALPLEPGWRLPFRIDGRPAQPDEQMLAQHISISAGYFGAFRASLAGGRFFSDADTVRSEPVVVVNQTLARRMFPGEDPVGRRIVSTAQGIGPLGRNLSGPVRFRIVGVVGDVQQVPLGRAAEPVIYHTHRQFPFRAMNLVVRGRNAGAVAAALRSALRQVDAALPLSDVRTMAERRLSAAAAPRLLMFVLTAFATLTAGLAAVGVYGLLACYVSDRRREMAIRLALGAPPRALAAIVTRQGLTLAAGGVVAGILAAQLSGRWLGDLLFQTHTTDPGAIAAVAALLLAAAGVACAVPARRAARVEPVDGLKSE